MLFRQVPAALCCSIAVASPALAQQPPTPVRVDAARTERVQETRRVTGEIWARRRALVASEESGLTLNLPVDIGDRVTKGQVLAELDATILKAQLAQMQAAVEAAKARLPEAQALLDQAEHDMLRMEDMRSRGAVKDKEFDDADTNVRTSVARLEIARRAVTVAETTVTELQQRIAKKTIAAPFDGVVMRKETEVGSWVSEGGTIVELLESGRVDAVLDVPEQFLAALDVGLAVDVIIPALAFTPSHGGAGPLLQGAVRAIVPEADRIARTFPVKVELDDLNGALRPGMSVSALIPTGSLADGLTIDRDAIYQSPGGPMVYVVQAGGQGPPSAVPAIVSVIASVGSERVAIAAGPVQAGDQLVVEGNERLAPGSPVVIVQGEAQPAEPVSAGNK